MLATELFYILNMYALVCDVLIVLIRGWIILAGLSVRRSVMECQRLLTLKN